MVRTGLLDGAAAARGGDVATLDGPGGGGSEMPGANSPFLDNVPVYSAAQRKRVEKQHKN